jgi:uncharacterized protein
MDQVRPFHLALPVSSIAEVKSYYGDVLGCSFGRFTDAWIDINFFGHQVVFHQVPGYKTPREFNPVDSKRVPVPHFGVVLSVKNWSLLADRLKENNTDFIIEPYTRFKDTDGEQHTLFFADPNGYCLEFKALANDDLLFSCKETVSKYN